MPDESGFEVAAAFVTVTPDASDFEQALDEAVGGLAVAVRVLPDASDFQGAIDQEDFTADVRLIPNLGGFEDQVDEQLGGMTATIEVGADTAPAQGELHGLLDEIDAARGDLFVGADTGAARKQAQDLADEFSGLSAQFSLGADTGSAPAGVQSLTGELGQLSGAAGAAQAALSGVEGGIAAIESRAETTGPALAGLSGVLAGGFGGVAGITVVPEVPADFADMVEEETGALVATARLVPDTADFQDMVAERLGGLTATVAVFADLGGAESQVRGFAEAGIPELGGVQQAADDAGEAVTVSAEAFQQYLDGRAAAQAGIDALNGVTSAADEAAASIEGDFDSMEAEAGRLAAALAEVDSQFLSMANAQFGPATDAELADMTARFENLYGEMESVTGELAALRGEFAAAGGDFGGLDAGLGGVAGALRTFDENLAGTEEALSAVAGDFFDLQEQAARMGVSLDDLGPAADAAFAVYVAGADAARASLAELNAESGVMGAGVAAGAAEAGEAAGGLGGVFASLGERLSYMAVDPFMWMMVGTTAIPELTKAWDALNQAMGATDDEISKQSGASGFNVAGYQKAAEQLHKLAGTFQVEGGILGPVEEWLTGGPIGMSSRTQEAAESAESMATNLSSKLGELGGQYHLTSQQADALAEAAGVSAKQLGASGAAGDAAAAKIDAYAKANIGAAGPVGELSGDMVTFANDALTASSRVSALDDAYDLLVGNFVSSQQAALGVSQDFLTIASNAEQAGASMTGTNEASVTLQQSFFELPEAIEETAAAMVKQGDSTQQVTSYIGDQIQKLSGLTGGSAEARQAVEGLKEWDDKLTQSTKSFNAAADQAASAVAARFTAQIKAAGHSTQATTGLVGKLTESIEDTGTTSQRTAGLRQELISDLHRAGMSAKDAKADVEGFIQKIGAIPASTNWKLTETAQGTWSEAELLATGAANIPGLPGYQPPGGSAHVPGLARGGLVLGGSGRPRADDIPSLLSNKEYVVQADAVDKYGVGMLDSINARRFASGGLASADGSWSGSGATGLGSWTQGQYDATENALAGVLVSSADAAGKAAAGTVAKALGGANGSVQAMAQKAAAARGWTGAQWAALNSVEMAEAGWNLGATNPGSGAYGIAQFIGGPEEYAQYGGNAGTAAGQVTAMDNYISQRYGNPEAAWAHEQQYHWYKDGGRLNPGQSAVVGDGGLPEVVTAGMSGATVTPTGRGGNTVNVYFTGMAYPTAEQIANLKSEMAFALVSAP